ncbi:hypothetical protein ACODNH_07070 [Haloarcula sp. NS06]|uniref:hypothetical protein n=1 Tax=Haloarcula sp. NS06 TaxID=3409688 RepID=UPI003DA74ED4
MTDEDPTFIRRKFTITEVLDLTLQQMAARHYQGNVSLCLRAAIESHRQILEGEGQFALQQVQRKLENVEHTVQEMQSKLDEIPVETAEEKQNVDSQPILCGIQLTDEMSSIVEILENAHCPLRLGDILEQTELTPAHLQPNLSRLVDRGLVVITRDGRQRFGLAGRSNSSRNREGER